MADTPKDAPVVDVAPSGNCKGELVQLPSQPGTTFNSYECQSCHQIVNVGFEDEATNGLPAEHSPTPAAE